MNRMIQAFFGAQVPVVAMGWVAVLWGACPWRRSSAAAGMLLWLLFTGALGMSGLLQRFDRRPPPMAFLVVAATVLTAVLALSRYGARVVNASSISLIAGLQGFRVAVEIFLWWGGRIGLVPPQMTFEGRNFDVLTGITALPVAWLFARGSIGRAVVGIWNVLGLALLLNVMAVAVLSFPTSFEYFKPANTFVATLPYVWLPTVLVQAAWFLHLILFRQLWARRSGV
jgi:hypothetical protein